MSTENCTDPQHCIPRTEFNGLSFHEYEAEQIKLWGERVPDQKLVKEYFNLLHDNVVLSSHKPLIIFVDEAGDVPDRAWRKAERYNRYVPRFLKQWRQKYLCGWFNWHIWPEHWQNVTSFTCTRCARTVVNWGHDNLLP